jgi:hypothetical protein
MTDMIIGMVASPIMMKIIKVVRQRRMHSDMDELVNYTFFVTLSITNTPFIPVSGS